MNVLRPSAAGIKPNLTFIIESADGKSLGQYSTGDIIESAAPEWKKHALIFTTPQGILSGFNPLACYHPVFQMFHP